jgi:RHS repeat-associated protein
VGSNAAITVSTNANGNITGIPPANSNTPATFTYNVANRLSSVIGSPLAATFVYDGFGQRYSKTNPGSNPINYTYDLASHLLEENNSGSVTDYIYLNGNPLSIFVPGVSYGNLYYVHTDRQATPQFVTNTAQTSVWSTTYQPYGTTPTIVSSITQNLRFPGQTSDLETGFNYNHFRDYMPNLGRYLESDPIGIWGGLNPYRYANANPGQFTDSMGLSSVGQQLNQLGAGTTVAGTLIFGVPNPYFKLVGGTTMFTGFCMQAAGALLDPTSSLMGNGTDLAVIAGTNIEGPEGIAFNYYASQLLEPLFAETVNAVTEGLNDANQWFSNTPVGTSITNAKNNWNTFVNSLGGQQ